MQELMIIVQVPPLVHVVAAYLQNGLAAGIAGPGVSFCLGINICIFRNCSHAVSSQSIYSHSDSLPNPAIFWVSISTLTWRN